MALKIWASKENIYANRNEHIEEVRKRMRSVEISHRYTLPSMDQLHNMTEIGIR